MSEKVYTLDLTDCKSLRELHQRIKASLNFPDFYGKNWSAFWDCINTEFDGEKVIVVGADTVAGVLKSDIDKLFEILERNKKYWENSNYSFDYEIV